MMNYYDWFRLVDLRGLFRVPWRAANGEKVNRRELKSVDVEKLCKDLKSCTPIGNPDENPDVPREPQTPQLTLRFSSKLMHGLAICQNLKTKQLEVEVHALNKNLRRRHVSVRQSIDLPPSKLRKTKDGRLVPDNHQLDINFDDPNHFFRLDPLPDVAILHTSTEESSSSSSDPSKRRPFHQHTVDLSEITLREEPLFAMFPEDPDASAEAMTSETQGPFNFDVFNIPGTEGSVFDDQRPSTSRGPKATGQQTTMARTAESTPASAVLTETLVVPPTPTRAPTDKPQEESVLAVPLPQEDAAAGVEAVGVTLLEDSVLVERPQPEPMELVLEPLERQRLPRRRRRQTRLIIDSVIGLTSDQMRRQMRVRMRTTQDYRDEGQLDEPITIVPASNLLGPAPTIFGRHALDFYATRQRSADSTLGNLFDSMLTGASSYMAIPPGERRELERRSLDAQMDESSHQVQRAAPTGSGDLQPQPQEEQLTPPIGRDDTQDASRRHLDTLAEEEPMDRSSWVDMPELLPQDLSKLAAEIPDISDPSRHLGEISSIREPRNISGVDVPQVGPLSGEESDPALLRPRAARRRTGTEGQRDATFLGIDISGRIQSPPLDGIEAEGEQPEGIPRRPQLPLEMLIQSDIQDLSERTADETMTFSMLAPPATTSKKEAARKFYALLSCAKEGTLKLKQEYGGEIEITKPSSL